MTDTLAINKTSNEIDCIHMTDEELVIEIKRRLEVCAHNLVELANVVCPAIRRGIALPFIRPGMLDVLRKIEGRQILPELANQFMYCRAFNELKQLPLDDQQKIVETGMVEMVVRQGESFTMRKKPVDALNRDQCRVVFSNGRLRSQQEMINYLESQGIEPDDDEQQIVSFRVPNGITIDCTKAESKLLKEKADRCGGLSELVKHAIKRML